MIIIDGKLGFSEKTLKNHMAEIMNKENDWDLMTEARMVKGSIQKFTPEEVTIAIKAVKPAKAVGPFEEYAKMISASGEVRINVMIDLYQGVLNGKETLDEWQTSVLAQNHHRKRSCKQ